VAEARFASLHSALNTVCWFPARPEVERALRRVRARRNLGTSAAWVIEADGKLDAARREDLVEVERREVRPVWFWPVPVLIRAHGRSPRLSLVVELNASTSAFACMLISPGATVAMHVGDGGR
jgi:hypothetical protein